MLSVFVSEGDSADESVYFSEGDIGEQDDCKQLEGFSSEGVVVLVVDWTSIVVFLGFGVQQNEDDQDHPLRSIF
jgi:hypothetical protein